MLDIVSFLSEPCAACAKAFFLFQSLAQCAQTQFCFSRALRSVRKLVFVFQEPCAGCASVFYFHFAFARRAQASFILETSLRSVRKPVLFLIRPCAECASLSLNPSFTERGAEHLKENNRSQEVNHDLREHAVNRQCPRLCWCELAAFVCPRIKFKCGCFLTSRKNCWLFLSKMKF